MSDEYEKAYTKLLYKLSNSRMENLEKQQRIKELETLLKNIYENKLEPDKLYIILSRQTTKKLISEGGEG